MAKNIIQRTIIDLNYSGNTSGFAIQKEISDWCNLKLAPGLEEILDRADTGAGIKKIDKIELEINLGSKKDWLSYLSKEITLQLQKKLNELTPVADGSIMEQTRSQNFFETLIYFLQKGYLPWSSTIRNRSEFSSVLLSSVKEGIAADVKAQLLQVISEPAAKLRLVDQLSDEEWIMLVAEFYSHQKKEIQNLFKDVNALISVIPEIRRKQVKSVFKIKALEHAADPDATEALRIIAFHFAREIYSFTDADGKIAYKKFHPLSIITDMAMGRAEKESALSIFKKTSKAGESDKVENPAKPATKQKERVAEEQLPAEGIYINNAGLVIIAPFLPAFFKKLNIVKEDIISERELAVNLVTYLATGVEYAAEFELVFAKILCGLEPSAPVTTLIAFTDEQKQEAEELLLSAIEYWTVVKDTSPQGLRESFLQREGKLSFINGEWILQVEQKPFDMLLQSLSWNISMIKLPWMETMLKTEWVY